MYTYSTCAYFAYSSNKQSIIEMIYPVLSFVYPHLQNHFGTLNGGHCKLIYMNILSIDIAVH